jgi:hypothetical protein
MCPGGFQAWAGDVKTDALIAAAIKTAGTERWFMDQYLKGG